MCETLQKEKVYFDLNDPIDKAWYDNRLEEILSQTFVIGETVQKEYNLKELGWTLGFMKSTKTIARCTSKNRKGQTRLITFSIFFLEGKALTREDIEQILLHEMAHAIDYEWRGTSDHGRYWKYICRKIGYLGERTRRTRSTNLKYKWSGRCSKCGKITINWSRKPKRTYYHTACDNSTWQHPIIPEQNF